LRNLAALDLNVSPYITNKIEGQILWEIVAVLYPKGILILD
jgi:transposase